MNPFFAKPAPFRRVAGLVLAACLVAGSARAGTRPLFESDDVLQLRIEAPFRKLIGAAATSTEPFEARLVVISPAAESLAIRLAPRGISRRNPENCGFPPLRIEFTQKPPSGSLFHGQKKLKLATHCRNNPGYQDYGLLEFLAYRLNNVVTPLSFRVRLAEIDYVEARTGSLLVHRRAFLVEDAGDLAARNGLQEVHGGNIDRNRLDGEVTASSDLFQYMIGNHDWSDVAVVAGSDCCHNIKLLGKAADSSSGLMPVAYDFDSSGLVDAPYALPPPKLHIGSVRTRYYRGYCQFTDQARAAVDTFIARKSHLLAAVDAVPALSGHARDKARQYLESFFAEVSDPARLQQHLIGHCLE
jgi:hypothetical protein